MKLWSVCLNLIGLVLFADLVAQGNPFLRPGSNRPVQPVIHKPAPPPPPPIPHNPNVEFRGYFKIEGEWHFALFDKSKNRGEWLQEGESMTDGGREIKGFDLQSEELTLDGGVKLSLKKSDNQTIPLPYSQPRQPPKKTQVIPPPRR